MTRPVSRFWSAVAAGLSGAVCGAALGLDAAVAAALAGLLGGVGDVAAHVIRGDEQFRAALSRVR